MKHNSIFAILFVALLGCATVKQPALPEGQPNRPQLREGHALSIGVDYAITKGWEIKHVWSDVSFKNKTGEWQMFFDIKDRGGPYIVYVNDKTKAVRFERGM